MPGSYCGSGPRDRRAELAGCWQRGTTSRTCVIPTMLNVGRGSQPGPPGGILVTLVTASGQCADSDRQGDRLGPGPSGLGRSTVPPLRMARAGRCSPPPLPRASSPIVGRPGSRPRARLDPAARPGGPGTPGRRRADEQNSASSASGRPRQGGTIPRRC